MDDRLFLVLIFGVAVASGATAALIGFGIGSLLTPLLLTKLDPAVAVAAVAIPHLAATALRFQHHRPAINRQVLLLFGVPSAVGGAAGALLQGGLRSPALAAALAVLLISTGVANLTRGFGGWRPSARVAVTVGFLSGLFGGLVGNQGGLRAAGLSAFPLQPREYLATGTAVALLIDAARTPIYLATGAAALPPLAVPIAVATVGCLVGTVLGERLFFRVPAERYRPIVGGAVLALGVWLLTAAAQRIW